MKTGYPPAKNVNETALYEDHFFLKPVKYTQQKRKKRLFLALILPNFTQSFLMLMLLQIA